MKSTIDQTSQTFSEVQLNRKTTRRQVGILGGNFNPVHIAHLSVADQVGHALGLDKVYLMPENKPPHVDEKPTIPAYHRLNMLKVAVEENLLLEVETIELERSGKSYTYDTMKLLTEKNPETDYYFIIGGDMVEYLPKWYKIDELVQMVHFVGVKRANHATQTPYPIIWIDVPLIDISSSLMRRKISEGCSTNYYLPVKVEEYIKKEGLYLD